MGFAQLQKGSTAILTCPPEYAYGSHGAGDIIPPNATLLFEVEVLNFTTPEETEYPSIWQLVGNFFGYEQ